MSLENKNSITNEKIFDYMKSGFEMVMGEIVETKERVIGLENRMGSLENQVNSLENRMGGLENKVNGLENRMVIVENKIDKIDIRLIRVEEKLDTAVLVIKDHEKRICKLETAPI